MPRASEHLRNQWYDEAEALARLETLGIVPDQGCLRVTRAQWYQMSGLDHSAVEYLVQEWDYDGDLDRDSFR
jgi:hypothetical protein